MMHLELLTYKKLLYIFDIMIKKSQKIPKFNSEQERTRFWETHDDGRNIIFVELTHDCPELDAAHDVFRRDIPAEFLETKEFLRNRLRVRDEGAKTDQEKILVQDGYTLHLIVAKLAEKLVGAIYGHLISKIGKENRGIGFITYISVLREHRRTGVGSRLVNELRKRVEEDSLRLTGKPAVGMVYEVEAEGKGEIKGLVRKSDGMPLDIVYYQPALHDTTVAEPMHLWLQPLDPHVHSDKGSGTITYPAEFVKSMVFNLLTMEYVGPEMKGFDPESKPYREFLESIGQRKEIGSA